MNPESAPILTIAVSSRALFDFEDENRVFESDGPGAYRKFQEARLDEVARPGVAFALVNKLLALNAGGKKRVEVVVLSRNDPVTGLRVFRSVEDANLNISGGVFTRGAIPFPYLHPLGAHLFLSAHRDDVKSAIDSGFAAARVYVGNNHKNGDGDGRKSGDNENELRIAFDGDAVLFGDESERVHQEHGLSKFTAQEKEMANRPLSPGPFKPFLESLHRLRESLPANFSPAIRIALITARGAPAHERAIRTLMSWDVEVDEALFLAGRPKEEFIAAFAPDFFFDDQTRYCEPAAAFAPTAHVDFGVMNKK